MRNSFLNNLAQFFRNLILNAVGAERTLLEYVAGHDIGHAIALMESHVTDVDNAIAEYYPQQHKIMRRPNKRPKKKDPVITNKLPRARQRYINEIELFFLLGKPIIWKKDDGDDEAFSLFTDFLKQTRFDSNMRKVKRLAGAETECAKYYHLYKDDDNKPHCDVVILARSLGYELRTLKDQYGKLVATAHGYKLRDADGKTVQHWEILTPQATYIAKKSIVGWNVEEFPNPTEKINLIYFQQPKSWDGAEPRLEREEMVDSKIGDTNDYFADPIALATADVIQSLPDPNLPGRLLQALGPNSRYEYVNPPEASELRKMEKETLETSILFDTFTPDFSFDKLRGLGTLTGVAIKNAMALGYLKRANRMEIYEEMVDREKNVIIAILKFLHPAMEKKLDALKISFEFAEPFGDDNHDNWKAIESLYDSGLISLETAVRMLALTDAPEKEIERIKAAEKASKPDKPTEPKPEPTGEGE